jgi:hypothetical protein
MTVERYKLTIAFHMYNVKFVMQAERSSATKKGNFLRVERS